MKCFCIVLFGFVSFMMISVIPTDVVFLSKVLPANQLVWDRNLAEYTRAKEYPFFNNRRDFDITNVSRERTKLKNKKMFFFKTKPRYPIGGFPRKKVVAT